jgi:trimeric autotransporter adhesin
VNSNRIGRYGVQSQMYLSLAALFVLCLAFSPISGQAQTYTPNDIYTVVGGGATPTTPLTADLPGASAAIEDSSGNVYIAAPDSAYVFKLSSAGVLSDFSGLGYGGHNTDGGPASKALVFAVSGLAFDSTGNVYFADVAGSRIRKVTISTGDISTVAGNGDKCDHAEACGDGALAIDANLNLSESIAIDASGNIYIADSGDNRIRVVNVSTTKTITIAGVTIKPGYIATVAGQANKNANTSNACANSQTGCGNGSMASSATVFLTSPYGVALDKAGNIYIADTKDQMIRVVNTQAAAITIAGVTIQPNDIQAVVGANGIGCTNPLSGCGDGRNAPSAEVDLPQGIHVDASGNIDIADTGDNRVRVVNTQAATITIAGVSIASGTIESVVDSTGTQGFSGDGGASASADVDLPGGIWTDANGDLFIADSGNARIRIVNTQSSPITVGGTTIQSGDIETIAGGGTGGDGGPATSAQLALPWDAAEDAAGNVYIVDQGNNRIRVWNKGTTTVTVFGVSVKAGDIATVAGNGSAGWSGDGGQATLATLNAPSSIAFDPSGNLYIADSNNLVIREVTLAGVISTVAGQWDVSCYPTTGTCGDKGVATSATFALPLNIAFDSAGDLYISDWQGYKIRKVVPSGGSIANGIISTIAGTGTSGSAGNGKLGYLANLDHPAGLVVDSSANVYIADQYNGEVRQVVQSANAGTCSQSVGFICQWALNQDAKLAGDGLTKLQGSMWNPLDLAIDPSNNVYISGGNNNVVQRISAVTTIYSTVAGSTSNSIQGGFTGDKGPATSAKMANLGALVDGKGNLYIADGGNNRIRYVPLTPEGTASPTTLSLGQWAIGVTGSSLPVTFSSTGGEDLSLTGITFTGTNSGDFSQTNTCGTLPVLISPDDNCTISVSLTPSVDGPESATMNIASNGTGSPQTVTLTGSGPNFSISASPNTISVAPGASGVSTITLTPQAKFVGNITLGCTGNPATSTCTLNPASVMLYGGAAMTSTLTLQTTTGTAAGTYTLTITGSYPPLANPTTITLTVQ